MSGILLLVIMLLLLFISLYVFNWNILCPMSIVCLVMIVGSCGFIYISYLYNYYPNGYATIYTTLAIFIFLIFSVLANLSFFNVKKTIKKLNNLAFLPNEPSTKICLIISIITVITSFFIFKTIISELGFASLLEFSEIGQLMHSGKFETSFKLRLSFHLIGYITITTYIMSFIWLNNYIKNIKNNIIFNITLTILITVFIPIRLIRGGRLQIFTYVLSMVVAYYSLWHHRYGWNKTINFKYIICCILIIFSLGLSLTFIMPFIGRGSIDNNVAYIAYYAGGGLVSLDWVLENQTIFYPSHRACFTSLREKINRVLGLDSKNKFEPIFNDKGFIFVNGKRLGNVYTPLYNYWHDFGWFGIICGYGVIAYIFNILYCFLKSNSQIGLVFVIYHYSLIVLFMFSFGEYFTRNMLAFIHFESICFGVVLMRFISKYSKSETKVMDYLKL